MTSLFQKKHLYYFIHNLGHTYHSAELIQLQRYFKSITIVPLVMSKGSEIKWKSGSNVQIDYSLILSNRFTIELGFYLVKSVFHLIFFRSKYFETIKIYELRKSFRFIKHFSLALYFEKWYQDQIDIESTVFYSFWFNPIAFGIAKMNLRNRQFSIVRAHGYDIWEERNSPAYLPFRDFTLKNIDYLGVASIQGTEYLKDKFPQFRSKIHYSKLGIEDTSVPTIAEKPQKPTISILTCSSLDPIKRVPLLAKSIIKCEKLYNLNITWTHVGGGEDWNKLIKIKKDFKKTNWVFPGQLNSALVMDIYKLNRFTFFANVSLSEGGLPLSIMEALMWGLPVLATATGGNVELVNKSNGHLIDVDLDEYSLAVELYNFIQRVSKEHCKMSSESRSVFLEKCLAKNNYKNFMADLEKAYVNYKSSLY